MKISLITATLNGGDILDDTIKSVFEQSYKDIEYIVVDGASTDNTDSVVRRWSSLFGQRMKYIQGKDSGINEAINKGIKLATGDVVGLIHAGDTFTGIDVIERIAETFSLNEQADLLYGDVHFVSSKDKTQISRYYSGANFKRSMMKIGYAPPHPSLYCRRELFEKYGLYNETYRVAGDFEMFVRLLCHEDVKSCYLPLDMVAMTVGGLSTQWHNRLFVNTSEKRKALKDNGVVASYLLLMLRYIINISQYFRRQHT